MSEPFGLTTQAAGAVPLVGVSVTGDILGRGARVKVCQRYRNVEKAPVEAVYKFPLPEGSAVCGFSASVNGRRITGSVEERERAFEIYDKALEQGDGGFLLDEERPNIFTLSVGSLKPGSEAVIEVEYVTLLEMSERESRFVLPTTISPRYIPAETPEDDGIPADEKLHPEYAAQVPYGLAIRVAVHGATALECVESPSHAIKVDFGSETHTVSFAADTVRMDRDFVLSLTWKESMQSRAYRFSDGKHTFLQLDLSPEVDTESETPRGREVVFVLDCSGSMGGDSIAQARRALEVCLRALSEGCSFNVLRFGSSFESLFPNPCAYDAKSLEAALGWLRRVDADLGGTEVLGPLQDIYGTVPAEGSERQIILLTDGEVGNESQVMSLVKKNAGHTRFFSVGIGAGPNEHFIKGLSRAGRGTSEFIFPGERIEPKMLRVFRRVSAATLQDPTITWNSGGNSEQAPAQPAVFLGNAATVFARFDGAGPDSVTFRAGAAGKDLRLDVPVIETSTGRLPIPTLWARERIRDLEESGEAALSRGSRQRTRKRETWQRTVIDLSREYGILSQSTSFVAVEEREEKDRASGEIVLHKVPTLVTVGWHGRGSVEGVSAPAFQRQSVGVADASVVMVHRWATASDSSPAPIERRSARESRDSEPVVYSPSRIKRQDRADSTDLLMRLLSLQGADAGFEPDAEAAHLLGIDVGTVERIAVTLPGQSSEERLRVIWTAIVLAVLDFHFGGQSSVWSSLVRKSRGWLGQAQRDHALVLEGMPVDAWAREFVKQNVRLT